MIEPLTTPGAAAFTGRWFCDCGAVEFIAPDYPRVKVATYHTAIEHTPVECFGICDQCKEKTTPDGYCDPCAEAAVERYRSEHGGRSPSEAHGLSDAKALTAEADRLLTEYAKKTGTTFIGRSERERVFLCVQCGAAWGAPQCHSCKAEAVEVVENDDGTARCTRCGTVWDEREGSHMCKAPAVVAR